MPKIRKILCPTDLSEPSGKAFEHAVAQASLYGAEVIALHVIPTFPPVAAAGGFAFPTTVSKTPEVLEKIKESMHRYLEPARERGVEARAVIEEGNEVERILHTAAQMPADLLVMGTHGHGGFERFMLGSVTEKVIRKAVCPVLTVPPGAARMYSGGVYEVIVCPVDFSASSFNALEHAMSLASEAGSQLVVMHVVDWLPAEEPAGRHQFDLTAIRTKLEEDARRKMSEGIPSMEGVEVERLVVAGTPYKKVLETAQAKGAGLIVIGIRGRGAVDLGLFGSTTNHVVRAAECPVMTFRTRDKEGSEVFMI